MQGVGAVRGLLATSPDPLRSHPALSQAIYRSYLYACASIAEACKQELLGDTVQQYRGTEIVPAKSEPEIQWLNTKLAEFKIALEQGTVSPVDGAWFGDGDGLTGDLITPSALVTEAKQWLLALSLADDSIPLYAQKLRAPSDGLW